MNKNRIALRCANRLFTNGAGNTGARLVITSYSGRDIGGWGVAPLMNVIAEEIEAERKRDRARSKRAARRARSMSK